MSGRCKLSKDGARRVFSSNFAKSNNGTSCQGDLAAEVGVVNDLKKWGMYADELGRKGWRPGQRKERLTAERNVGIGAADRLAAETAWDYRQNLEDQAHFLYDWYQIVQWHGLLWSVIWAAMSFFPVASPLRMASSEKIQLDFMSREDCHLLIICVSICIDLSPDLISHDVYSSHLFHIYTLIQTQ